MAPPFRSDQFAAVRGRRRSAQRSLARRLAGLLGVFAVFAQSFLVQTHVHALHEPAAPAALVGDQANSSKIASWSLPAHSEHDACVLCQGLALAGAALPQPDMPLAEIYPPILRPSDHVVSIQLTLRAHPWQSRAPPIGT